MLLRPGLGKTTVSYAAIKILKDQKLIRKTLVVAPLRVAYNVWPNQKNDWEDFKELRVSVLHGAGKERALLDDSDIYVINPEGLEWLLSPKYEQKKDSKGVLKTNKKKIISIDVSRIAEFDVLLVDESTKFKAYDSLRFTLIKYALKYFKRRYILTGTITPNGLLDLFGQIFILDQGAALGRYITHYREKWFYPSGYGGYTWAPQVNAKEEISAKVAPLVIQIDHKDHLAMPELMPPNDIYIDLPPSVRVQYDMMEKKLKAQYEEGTVIAANSAVASGKCRQIANGALYTNPPSNTEWSVLHEEKLGALDDLLEELSGEPLLIAYQFRFDRELISKRLNIPSIGQGDPRRDMVVMEQFRKGQLRAVMGHPETISLGLDGLQDSCSNVCWFGVPWNLLHYLQTIDRIWRQGSRARTVSIHRLLARNTIDESVVEVLDSKDATQSDFLALLGRLTSAQ